MLGALVHSFWKSGPNVQTTDVNDDSYIASKNGMGSSFEVGRVSMFDGFKLFDVKNVLNSQASNKQQHYLCNTGNKDTIVPETYNFREEYPNCARKILTQRNCSSSYAIAAVSAITDRWCRANDLSFPVLSPQGPLACDKAINHQCKGGYLSRTLDYAKIYGLVEESCLGYNSTVSTPEECQKQTASCQKHKIADYCVSKEV
jgi:cathepsin B